MGEWPRVGPEVASALGIQARWCRLSTRCSTAMLRTTPLAYSSWSRTYSVEIFWLEDLHHRDGRLDMALRRRQPLTSLFSPPWGWECLAGGLPKVFGHRFPPWPTIYFMEWVLLSELHWCEHRGRQNTQDCLCVNLQCINQPKRLVTTLVDIRFTSIGFAGSANGMYKGGGQP